MAKPTRYKKEYCEEIYEFMKNGASLSAYANHIRVHRTSLYDWAKVHKEWERAMKEAAQASCVFYEGLLERIAAGTDGGDPKTVNARFKSVQWTLASRHQDVYAVSQKQEIEINDQRGMSEKELNSQLDALLAKARNDEQ